MVAIIFCFMSITITLLIFFLSDGLIKSLNSVEADIDVSDYMLKEKNNPYKCKCGIVSRKYQMGKDNWGCITCPHCKGHISYENKISDDRDFPFAPKISRKEIALIIAKEKELEKIEKEISNIKEYDKEIAAWERIHLEKIDKQKRGEKL